MLAFMNRKITTSFLLCVLLLCFSGVSSQVSAQQVSSKEGNGTDIYRMVNLSYNEYQPEMLSLYDILSISSYEEVEYACLSYPDGTSAVISHEDAVRLLEGHDSYYLIFTQPYEAHNDTYFVRDAGNNETYMNYYTKNGVFTVYMDTGDLCIGKFGKNNYLWASIYPGNRRNGVLNAYKQLYSEYYENRSDKFVPPTAPSHNYLNLPKQEWAAEETEVASQSNILPLALAQNYENKITRMEYCILLAQTIGECIKPGSRSDWYPVNTAVDDPDWNKIYKDIEFLQNDGTYSIPKSVKELYCYGIMIGREDGRFDPNHTITRQEAAKVLCLAASAAGWGTNDLNFSSETVLTFADQNEIAFWAKPYVGWAVSSGLMKGIGENRFDPGGDCTIEQAIAMASRFYAAA